LSRSADYPRSQVLIMGFAAQLIVLRNRAYRRDVSIDATIRRGITPLDIIIIDLSTTGFRAKVAGDLRVGDDIAVAAPALGALRARVVRQGNDGWGFEFWYPISDDDIQAAATIDTVEMVDFPQLLLQAREADAGAVDGVKLSRRTWNTLAAIGFVFVLTLVMSAFIVLNGPR
jgi:hypothetical protein